MPPLHSQRQATLHPMRVCATHVQFNARSETVASKGVFKRLLARQRCVVLAEGFYEWKQACTRRAAWRALAPPA